MASTNRTPRVICTSSSNRLLQVLVAHSGKTYELDCQSNTRIDIIQEALASLTHVSANEQILICGGVKLDAARTLNAYGLPSEQENKHVFLYNKSGLKPGTAPPMVEQLAPVELEVLVEPELHQTGHPLDSAVSPLIRALPHYERQFRFHLQKAQAVRKASGRRLEVARRLVSEMRVQVLSIDSARQNVDIHFNYICKAHTEFGHKYAVQCSQAEDLLSHFEADLERLRQIELHPGLQKGSERRTLLDCIPLAKLRTWHGSCERAHRAFGAKVADLAGMFAALQQQVEALFMTGPDVDVAQLEERVEDAQREEEEETSIVQSLAKDLDTVQRLVEETVGAMGSASLSASLRPVDACGALDPMNDLHVSVHLPKLEECDGELVALGAHLVECKAVLTRNGHAQLQSIAALQSRIRDLRCKLTAFKEVGQRQAAALAEFVLVRELPAQYRACLAEVVRRRAYAQLYAGQAAALAERMGHLRVQEMARRQAFTKHQERYLPSEVLQQMGLAAHPPQCEVSVPVVEEGLLEVSDQELMIVYHDAVPAQGAGGKGKAAGRTSPLGRSPGQSPGMSPRSAGPMPVASPRAHPLGVSGSPPVGGDVAASASSTASSVSGAAELATVAGDFAAATEEELARSGVGKCAWDKGGAETRPKSRRHSVAAATVPGAPTSLEMENARLRADLAAHVALLAVRPPLPPAPESAAGSVPSSAPGSHRGSECDDGAAAAGLSESALAPGGGVGPMGASAAALPAAPAADAAELDAAAARKVAAALAAKDRQYSMLAAEKDAAVAQAEAYAARIAALEAQLQLSTSTVFAGGAAGGPSAAAAAATEAEASAKAAKAAGSAVASSEALWDALCVALDAAAMQTATGRDGVAASAETTEAVAPVGLSHESRTAAAHALAEALQGMQRSLAAGGPDAGAEAAAEAAEAEAEAAVGEGVSSASSADAKQVASGMSDGALHLKAHSVVNSLLVLCTAWQQPLEGGGAASPAATPMRGEALCYTSFELGMPAVFLPLPGTGHYRALHAADGRGAHRYLSAACAAEFAARGEGEGEGDAAGAGAAPQCVVGQILRDESAIAYGEAGGAGNPYSLPQGTEFHILTVGPVGAVDPAKSSSLF